MKNGRERSDIRYIKIVLAAVALLFVLAAPLFGRGTPEVPDIPPVSSGTQYISPNGDGVQDEASITFKVSIYVKSKDGYVPEYGLEIADPSGEVVKQVVEKEDRDIGWFASLFTGYKKFSLERSITWDGKNAEGEVVPDGSYSLSVWVADPSGKRQREELDDFVVDTKPPEALIVEPDELLFSPNGDGRKDTITISHTQVTEEDTWKGAIRNADGEAVRSFEWEGTPGDIEWGGENDDGEQVEDGMYSYVLQATDRAGNESGEIVLENIEVDTTPTSIDLSVEPKVFSPNGDGRQDTATVRFSQDVEEGIVGWSYSIRDIHNTLYETVKGEGAPPEEIELDGTTQEGKRYPQDRFILTYSLRYEHGNNPSAETDFRIDVTKPEIEVSVENPIFSPDGDGRKENVRITYRSDEEVAWKGGITSEEGEEVYATDSTRTTSLIVWDGRTEEGGTAEDGTYMVSGVFTDPAGNVTEPSPVRVTLDTKPVSVNIAAGEGFSPNDDGINDILPFTIEASQYEEVLRWELELQGTSGETKRVFSGEGTLPSSIEWDGDLIATEEGKRESAPEGYYTGKLRVEYKKGKSTGARTDSFFLDVTPPKVAMKVTKNPFAKTNGEVEGEVFIGVDIEEKETRVTEWTMDILNSEGEVIRTYTGSEDPTDDIAWNSASKENRKKFGDEKFTLRMKVSDAAGNTRTFTEEVTLDIFLVKKDGQYHIAVPNIIFGAYKHALDSKGPEIYERNRNSIARVVDIYRRYPKYGLLLEGHALNIYRGVSEKKEAEEEEILRPLTRRRADTVRDALVEQGMSAEKIETEWFGGTEPIVSVHDMDVRWKNRRVEFIMQVPKDSD